MSRTLRLVTVSVLGAALAVSAAAADVTHVLAPGETLTGLATQLYGASWKAVYLTARNGLASEKDVPPGTRLVVPTCILYKVRRGETLAEIARRWLGDKDRFKVLAQENGIKDATDLEAGAELLLPFVLRHVAEPGESWSRIAQRYYRNSHRAALVKDYNPTLTALTPGDKVLVPIFDRATLDAASRRPTAAKAPPPAPAPAAKATTPPKVAPASTAKAEPPKTSSPRPTTAGAPAQAGKPPAAAPPAAHVGATGGRPAATTAGGTSTPPSATAPTTTPGPEAAAARAPPPAVTPPAPAPAAPGPASTTAAAAGAPPASASATPTAAPSPGVPAGAAATPTTGAPTTPGAAAPGSAPALTAGAAPAVASLSAGAPGDGAPRPPTPPHSAAVDVVRGLSPGALHTLVLRAIDEYRRGEFEVACGKLEAALGAEVLPLPDRAATVSHLGFCAIAAGDRGAAVDYFKKWLELDPRAELDPVTTSPKILAAFQEVAETVRGETNEPR